MIPTIRQTNVLVSDVDTPEEVEKIVNDLYRICRAQNLEILKLSGKGEGKKGGEKTPPGKVSTMKKATMAVIAVLLLLLTSIASASVPWMVEYAGNADLMDAFMRNPQFKNIETDTITLANGATIDNATNNAFEFNENSEELILTVSSDTVTWSSGTGVVTMGFGAIVPTANQFLATPKSTPVGTVEGTIYYDSDVDKLYLRNASTWVDLTATTTSTLDDIYNNSVSGGALTITVDTGAIVLNNTDADAAFLLSLTPTPSSSAALGGISIVSGANSTQDALHISHAGSGKLIHAESFDIDSHGDVNAVGMTLSAGLTTTTYTTTPSLVLENGATIGNSTDTEIVFGENSEDISLDFTTDGLTVKTSTGVAAINWADTDDFTGLNNLTFDASASAITLPANSANDDLTITCTGTQDSHLTVSCAGTTEDAITISTTNGGINITNNGAAAGEDLDLSSTAASINLTAAEAVADAIVLTASNAAGGIDVTAGADIDITTTGADGEDISIINTGGSVWIEATEAVADAVTVKATTALGGIDISSQADVDITTTGGDGEDISLVNTGGSILLQATESAADAVVVQSTVGGVQILASGAADTEDILLTATGSSVFVTSTQAVADAIKLNASDAAGGITVAYGTGNMAITGSGVSADFSVDCDLLSIDATGTSNISFANAAGEDVTIATTGAADHSLIISATGTGADAMQITTSAGGLDVTVTGASGEDLDLRATTSSIVIRADENIADAITLNASAGGIDVNCAGASAEDIDLTNVAGSINLTAGESAVDSVKILSSIGGIQITCAGAAATEDIALSNTGGSIYAYSTEAASDAIELRTADGGIEVNAVGAANGDLTFTVGDDWTTTVAGNTSLTSTGTTAITTSDWGIDAAGAMTKIDAITFDNTGAGINCNNTVLTGFKYTVQHAIANDTLLAAESGRVVYVAKAGAGAATDIEITLPAAAAGLTFTIVDANETAAADVTIRAGTGDKINDGSAAGAYVHDTDADNYASCTLVAIDDVDWVVRSSTGTWSNE